jgi:hypothetical protein
VTIYYEGAEPSEIAAVESLSPDVHIYNVTDRGGEMDVFCNVDRAARLGPRAFRVRKTNGATAIVTGIVGVVAPFWLGAPPYTLEAGAGAPVEISWTNFVPRDEATTAEVSVSVDGGAAWEELGRVEARTTSFVWQPDPGLVTSALRFRIRALDAVDTELAIDESVFNIGLGRPARGGATGGADTTAPAVRVTSPNGGETLAGGEPVQIAWEADDDIAVASQEVEVSVDGGGRWAPVGAAPATARTIAWTPAAKPADAVLVRVTARDRAGNAATDASDAAARVRLRPSISRVTSKPKGAEIALKIKGTNLAAGAVVRINGEAVGVAVAFSRGALKLHGDAAALHLAPPGATNAVVVEVDGLASAEAEFASP